MKGIRRALCILLVTAMLCAPSLAEEERLAVGLFSGAMLIDRDGEVLIPLGEYQAIYPLTGGAFAFVDMESGKYALGNETGAVTEFLYDFIEAQGDTIYCVEGPCYGVLTPEGEQAVPCQYTYLTHNGEGGYLGLRTDPYDENPDGVYHLDGDGAETPTGVKVLHVYARMQEGLLPAMSTENGMYGYLGGDGLWAIAPQYEYAGPFVEGRAAATASTGAGLISPEGSWLVTPQYDYVDNPETPGKYRYATGEAGVCLIDNDTWRVARRFPGGSAFSAQGYVVVTSGGETVLFGPEGDEKFRLSDEYIISAWDIQGERVVVSRGEWGEEGYCLYDMTGEPVSDGYQWIVSMGNGLFAAARFQVEKRAYQEGALTLNEEVPGTMREGCLDGEGQLIIPMEYEILYALSHDRLWTEKDGKGYLCDEKGQVIQEYDISLP